MTTERVIEAVGVRERGRHRGAGLNGFDLEVTAGTVTGLLGPNGPARRQQCGSCPHCSNWIPVRRRSRGTTSAARARRWRRIGLVGQYAAVDEVLTGRQNLVMFGRLNHLGHAAAVRRADELLERFSLTEAAGQSVTKYSGGMRRRLDLAAS